MSCTYNYYVSLQCQSTIVLYWALLYLQLFFHKAVQNDTLFLSIVNVVDYSILVGLDENTHEVVVGIIDYMRQVRWVQYVDREFLG